jgi:hypothetical protein
MEMDATNTFVPSLASLAEPTDMADEVPNAHARTMGSEIHFWRDPTHEKTRRLEKPGHYKIFPPLVWLFTVYSACVVTGNIFLITYLFGS